MLTFKKTVTRFLFYKFNYVNGTDVVSRKTKDFYHIDQLLLAVQVAGFS
jgi:hypothetical protein